MEKTKLEVIQNIEFEQSEKSLKAALFPSLGLSSLWFMEQNRIFQFNFTKKIVH